MPGELRRREFLEDQGVTRFMTTHFVDDSHDGWRVDLYLKEKLRKRSRAYIQRSIDNGIVTLSPRQRGQTPILKPSTILQAGDVIQVVTYKTGNEPEVDFNYRVLYEDDAIMAINKPGNLPVHPAGRFFFNTLLSRLRTDRMEDFKNGQDFYMVHRIDRETSGILLMAKNSEAAAELVRQFREHEITKRYLAITNGISERDQFEVDLPISADPVSNIRLKRAAGIEGAAESQEAYTAFKVLKRNQQFSLIECYPTTGRQHQIRVHLSSQGLPLVGDKLYSGFDDIFFNYLKDGIITSEMQERLILPRHALHASYLKFTHPKSGAEIEVHCPLPEDLAKLI